jgi:hexokinase
MNDISTDIIRNYFKRNNFYNFLHKPALLTNNFNNEYNKVAVASNLRNLKLTTKWKEINSYGKPRRIISLDLGGTNLNIHDINVTSEKNIQVEKNASIDFYEDKIYTPEILFEDLRKQLDQFVLSSDARNKLQNIVFIFSYPIEQIIREDGYIDAIVKMLNKTRKHEGIIGIQIGQAFEEYLHKHGYPNVKISVTNDAPIYCLAAKSYEIQNDTSFDAAMNIIVGTGTNISAAFDDNNGLRVINTEFGDFNVAHLSRFDEIFDKTCDIPGKYLNEKMISGAWMHQIFKIIIKDLIDQKIIPEQLMHNVDYNSFKAAYIEEIIKTRTVLKEEQIDFIEFIWRELNKRGAAICGISIANILENIRRELNTDKASIIIMETGSALKKGYRFREQMIDFLEIELGRQGSITKIDFTIASLEDQAAHGAVIFDTFFTK